MYAENGDMGMGFFCYERPLKDIRFRVDLYNYPIIQ